MDADPSNNPQSPAPNPYEPPRSPQRPRSKNLDLAMRIQGGFWVVLSSLIAFVTTCVPLGTPLVLSSRPPDDPPPYPEWLPWVAGLVVSVGVGFGVGMFLVRWNRWVDQLPPSASDGSDR